MQPAGERVRGFKLNPMSLSLLVVVYTFCYIDRQVINILAQPIKVDLHLTDSELGLLTGIAFTLFYSTLAIPIARLAEKYHRGWVIAGSIAIWSAFTIACGLAKSFGWLLAARVGVGIGEAGCTPAANSLIVDYTPPERRARSISIYMLGVPFGLLIGMVAGGSLADLYGWRIAFVLAGVPGFLLAAVTLLLIKDPLRRKARVDQPSREGASIKGALKAMARNRPFVLVAVGGCIASFMANGQMAFLAAFLLRAHGESLAHVPGFSGPTGVVGLTLGLIGGVGGAIGMLAGGWLADRFGGRRFQGYMTICAVAAVLTTPFFLIALLADEWWTVVAALVPAAILGSMWGGPVFAIIPTIVAPEIRATAVAVGLFGINLIGHGAGPLATGILSDVFGSTYGSAEGLRWALVVSTLVGLGAIPFYLGARRSLGRESGQFDATVSPTP